MNTLTIISWVLGLASMAGLGVGAFLLVSGGIAVPLALVGVVNTIKGVVRFFSTPVGQLALAGLVAGGMFVGGEIHGRSTSRAQCEARIADSIRKNAEFDKKLQEDTAANARQQELAAEERVRAAEQKVVDYEKLHASCVVGDDAADWLNDDGGMRPQGRAIPKPPQPPRRP